MRFVPGVVPLSKKTEPVWWFVFRGDKLLIPGETLEECVRREVKEEVGIEVENICYFGSQSWPFPNSLMVAFTADYANGKITIDETETIDAGWFTAHNLPPIPDKVSISRRLIDSFVNRYQ